MMFEMTLIFLLCDMQVEMFADASFIFQNTLLAVLEADVTPQSYHAVPAQQTGAEVSEEDVTLSYLGDELDMKTVGDIIAIIEEKVKEKQKVYSQELLSHALVVCGFMYQNCSV